ncbi:MAG: hypothetical protein JNL28_16610 [Planctomycetes bacterium]|nr:hypothetical protein [Planctomycetota bacterium]
MRRAALLLPLLVALGCQGPAPTIVESERPSGSGRLETLFGHFEFQFAFPCAAVIAPDAAVLAATGVRRSVELDAWLAAHGALIQLFWLWTPPAGQTTVQVRDLRHSEILLEQTLPTDFRGALAVVFTREAGADRVALCLWKHGDWTVYSEGPAAGEYAQAEPFDDELEALTGKVDGRTVQGGSVWNSGLRVDGPSTVQIWTWYGADAARYADLRDRFTNPKTIKGISTVRGESSRPDASQMARMPLADWSRPVLSLSAEHIRPQ